MKLRKDKNIFRFLGVAGVMVLVGILLISFLSNPTYYFGIGFALIIMGIVVIITAIIVAATPKEDLIRNERSVKINEKADYHAFCILLTTICLLQAIGMNKQ